MPHEVRLFILKQWDLLQFALPFVLFLAWWQICFLNQFLLHCCIPSAHNETKGFLRYSTVVNKLYYISLLLVRCWWFVQHKSTIQCNATLSSIPFPLSAQSWINSSHHNLTLNGSTKPMPELQNRETHWAQYSPNAVIMFILLQRPTLVNTNSFLDSSGGQEQHSPF